MGTKRNAALLAGALTAALLATVTGCSGKDSPSASADAVSLPGDANEQPSTTAGSGSVGVAAGRSATAAGKSAASVEATIDEAKVRLDVLDVTRGPGGMATLNFSITHLGGDSYFTSGLSAVGESSTVGAVYLVDSVGRKKYLPVRDDKGTCLCTTSTDLVDDGETVAYFAKYPPVSTSVKTVSVYVPGFPPVEDVPVS